MRRSVIGLVLSVAVLTPWIAVAQVYQLPTPAPPVTAASAAWQRAGEPIFYAGTYYYAVGPTVFFDGNIMKRTGIYRGVPLYVDPTVEPYHIVYLPVGRSLLRPYERRREGPLAGTVGSRMPSFPIQRDIELSAASGTIDCRTSMFAADDVDALNESPPAAYAYGGGGCCRGGDTPPPPTAAPAAAAASGVQSIPPPSASDGVWIAFEGGRWYSDGRAVSFDASRFSPIGNYRGFPVYRDTGGGSDRIFVTVVPDGPVAPFSRR